MTCSKEQSIKNLGTGMLGKKHSEETIEKIRIMAKGRKPSKSNIRAIIKSNETRGCSKQTKEKMRQARRGKPSPTLGKKGEWNLSIDQRKRMSESRKGEKSYSWKGGITSENERLRKSIEFRLWREAVFARDNWTCQTCKKRGIKLHPHHIKPFGSYPELRFAIDNGITLCEKCHKDSHTKNNKKLIQEFPK